MKSKALNSGPRREYLVTSILNGQMSQLVSTHQERAQLNPDDVDVQIDEPKREIWIKHDGEARSALHRLGRMPGFGVYEWNLLTDIVFSAGDVVQLASSPHVNQRIRRIRKSFADSKDAEFFFVTMSVPYGIRLNLARTWRYIEKLAEPEDSSEGHCDA